MHIDIYTKESYSFLFAIVLVLMSQNVVCYFKLLVLNCYSKLWVFMGILLEVFKHCISFVWSFSSWLPGATGSFVVALVRIVEGIGESKEATVLVKPVLFPDLKFYFVYIDFTFFIHSTCLNIVLYLMLGNVNGLGNCCFYCCQAVHFMSALIHWSTWEPFLRHSTL